MISINHPLISRITCLRKKQWYRYGNVLPFLPAYIVALASFWKVETIGACIILGIVAFFHILSFFMCIWSLRYRIHTRYEKLENIDQGDSIYVVAAPNCGKSSICELHRGYDSGRSYYWFDFQKLRFISEKLEDGVSFRLLDFPDHQEFETYLSCHGHTVESLKTAKSKWGTNDLRMEIPSFWELFIEHATAPFFVFQVFSVLLWCFDDYLFFTLFTLAMLIMMESMQVKQRIQNMENLRAMRTESFPVLTYRQKQWLYVNSSQLVPGDIISISSRPVHGLEECLVPCDAVLLNGTCVVNEAVLTGESVPKSKIGLSSVVTEETKHNHLCISENNNVHKRHMVYGGTRIILHKSDGVPSAVSPPPDHGCVAYVIRTGYYTSQGDMLRNMMYSSDRASANNSEAFSFIAILLVFALAAAAYVYRIGKQDERRNHWKLILHCIMIITNVVPPELPLELSYAVQNSLIALIKKGIYCTEPFRIPFGGRVKTCYFDKTGTLTSDKLILHGVMTCEEEGTYYPPTSVPYEASTVMAACQELVWVNGKITGNQMEVISLEKSGWNLSLTGALSPPKWYRSTTPSSPYRIKSLMPVFRYGFESANRRMTVVCSNEGSRQLRVFMKGAPEMVEKFLTSVPTNYHSLFTEFTLQGKRVISLAWKDLPEGIRPGDLKTLPRSTIESGLTHCGFLLFDCPLKTTTVSTVSNLRENNYHVKIITGDNAYTACEIAREAGIFDRDARVLLLSSTNEGLLFWEDGKNQTKFADYIADDSSLQLLASNNILVITGSLIIHQEEVLERVTPYVTIFARMSPQQKGDVIRYTKQKGDYCLMCGDGTNDVAALKQAHIGVSIMSNVDLEDKIANAEKKLLNNEEGETEKVEPPILQMAHAKVGNRRVAVHTKRPAKKQLTAESVEDLRDKLLKELNEDSQIKLGDASIASPFTCKSTGIDKVLQILRFGRCTLVTTFQIYIILALNSLINAYSLSVLYIDGVKNGDFQMTVSGFLIAGLFFFISGSKPLKTLSRERPPVKLFSWYIVATIAGQFVVHFIALYWIRAMTLPYASAEDILPDADFKPNVLNSVIFLIDISMQLVVFIVNYQGHPFMQSIKENKPLYYGFIISFGFFFLLSFEIIPPLNRMMELVPFPNWKFKLTFNGIAILDGVFAFAVDRVLKWIDRKVNKNEE